MCSSIISGEKGVAKGEHIMKQMTLSNIAKACNGRLVIPDKGAQKEEFQVLSCSVTADADTEILSVTLNSRLVKAGTLFFATIAARVDGHRFIGSAYEQGACCVVKGSSRRAPALLVAVKSGSQEGRGRRRV